MLQAGKSMRKSHRDLQAAMAARAAVRARRRTATARPSNPARAARAAVGSWSGALQSSRSRLLADRGAAALAALASGAALAAFIGWLQHSPLGWVAVAVALASGAALAWRRWRAGRVESSSPVFVSEAALRGLDHLTAASCAALPISALAALESLRLRLRGVVRESQRQGSALEVISAEDAATIAHTLQRDLPDCLQHFLAIPAHARARADEAQLLDQLQQLQRQIEAIEERIVAARRQALSLHGRFLRRARRNAPR